MLDEEALFEKIVEQRRGGFCYELNGLFGALLRALGFDVQRLSARVVRPDSTYGVEFDHMTLLVELGERWLVDVGFGDSFETPLRLDERSLQAQRAGVYRIDDNGDHLTCLRLENGRWKPQYGFSLYPYNLVDFAAGCHYHQTSPASTFTQKRMCTRATADGRITLSDMKLIVTANGTREEHVLRSEREYHLALWEHFGIRL